MKLIVISIILFSLNSLAGTRDFEYLSFLDENIKIGLGLTYSKLEANSLLGNYFLLSQANPRLELSYSSPVEDLYRHKFTASYRQEIFRTENPSLVVKTRDTQ